MLKKILVILLIFLPIQLLADAELFKSSGKVYFMESDQLGWKTIEPGYKITKEAGIRLGQKSIGIIKFQSNVSCYMREETDILLHKITNNIELELIRGSIQLLNRGKAGIRVKTLLAEMNISSESCLIKNVNNNIYISVFDKQISVKVRGKELIIKQGYGVVLTPKLDDINVYPLPLSPVPDAPLNKSIFGDKVDLKWNKIDDAMLYRLEVSLDSDFVQIINKQEAVDNYYTLENLKEGGYYWRISSISRKNLEGGFFDYNNFFVKPPQTSLVIKKKEEPVIVPDLPPIEKDQGEVSPNNDPKNGFILGGALLIGLLILIIL